MPLRSLIPAHKLPAALAVTMAVILGGMAAGQSIGDSPMLARHGDGTLPSGDYRPSEVMAFKAQTQAIPDQYAIETPHGRFEVSELAQRGLFSQRRFGGGHDSSDVPGWNYWEAQDAAIARELAAWDGGGDSYADQSFDDAADPASSVRVIRGDQLAEGTEPLHDDASDVSSLPDLALAR